MPDWDKVYADKLADQSTPARVLKHNLYLLPSSGYALDYACGLGGNAQCLAQHGLEVMAVDKSAVALKKLEQLSLQQAYKLQAVQQDIEVNPIELENTFDVICVSYFLHRETLPFLYSSLKPEGLLFYQTFSGQQLESRGPANPQFRLARGELLKQFSQMELLYYREDPQFISGQGGLPDQVQFVARK